MITNIIFSILVDYNLRLFKNLLIKIVIIKFIIIIITIITIITAATLLLCRKAVAEGRSPLY